MKTKTARKIAKSAAAGTVYPVHVLRKAALQLGLPLIVDTQVGDFTYFPKGLKGKFKVATMYRPEYRTDILPVGTDLSAYKGRNGYVRDLDLVAGQHELSVSGGCNIDGTCYLAASLSRVLRMRVPFDFNGSKVVARPNSTVDELYRDWDRAMERKRQEYYASDEYKKAQAAQLAENQRDQAIIDGLIATLDEAVKDRETLLTWLSSFAAVADNNAMRYPRTAIADTIKDAGYKSNAWVGQKAEIDADKVKEAEYIIGQALSCMDSGMPPHPVLTTFVKRHRGEEPYPSDEADTDEYEDEYDDAEEEVADEVEV